MLGTIVNTCTIMVGSAFGATAGNKIGEKYKKVIFNAIGLACLVLGANASIPNISKSEYPVMFILSIAIGGIIGTALDLSGRIDRLNEKLEFGENKLQGLITGLLLFCIGTFSIVGPVLSALSPTQGWAIEEQANAFLYTNATLDLVTSAVLAASFGWIMVLAAPVLFCWQGLFYVLALLLGSAMPEAMRVELSIVGGVLIISSGIGILGIKDCRTVNLLPSLLIPVVFYLIKGIF